MPAEKCKDFDKGEVKKTPFPVKLFHATLNAGSVCRDGLKYRKEVKKQGLGGGVDDLISFTSSPAWAVTIAKDLQTAVKIANREVTFDNICQHLDRSDRTPAMQESPCDVWRSIEQGQIPPGERMSAANITVNFHSREDLAERIQMAKQGYVLKDNEDWTDLITLMGEEKVRALRAKNQGKDVKPARRGGVQMLYYFVQASPEEVAEELFKIYRKVYLPRRQELGGRRDPYFFATTAKQLRGFDPKNVGIVEVEGFLPISPEIIKNARSEGDIHELLHYKDGKYISDPGVEVASAMDEVRLAKDRFHKLKLRGDLLQERE